MANLKSCNTFQQLILRLQNFWAKHNCTILQPIDIEVGAGTLNKHTFLRALGPEPWNCAYVEPCRRPTDGRFGENPNRLQHYYQFQVLLKPSPKNVQQLYLDSLVEIGLDPITYDVRFVQDDWEHPGLGASGLGWEVWAQGMEITQFTYFQQCGGIELPLMVCELTYGLERIAMYLQNVNNVYDLVWHHGSNNRKITYGDIHHNDEVQFSNYNFHHANTEMYFTHFDDYEKEAKNLLEQHLPLPAYDCTLKCSHIFNMLEARSAVSVTQRARYIARIRNLAKSCAKIYLEERESKGFPLLK